MRLALVVFAALVLGLTMGIVFLARPEPRAPDPVAHTPEPERPAGDPVPAGPTPESMPEPDPAIRADTPSVRALGLESLSRDEEECVLWPMGAPGPEETTRVELRLDYPAGGLVIFEHFESTLTAFSDDRGTDLMAAPGLLGPFWPSWEVAEDGKSMVFVVHSDLRPHPEASTLHLVGTIVVTTSEARRVERARVVLEQGAQFRLGSHELAITKIGTDTHFLLNDWTVTIRGTEEPSLFAEWRVEDADGNEVMERAMNSSYTDYWEEHFTAPRPLESAVFVLSDFAAPREDRVPFDVTLELPRK